jgi:PAS domain S-box-containing protein
LGSLSFGQIKELFQTPIDLPTLMDGLSTGVIITDRVRRVVFLNSASEALTGFSRVDVRGVPCCHVLRASVCNRDCVIVGAEKSNAPVTMEADIVNRQHRKIPVRLSAAPLHDTQGTLVGFLETVEDIGTSQETCESIQNVATFSQLIGRSSKMKELFQLIPVVAQTDSSLLITGETGTGKDVLAEVIHKASDRSEGAFIKINCGALPETLLESELFGHRKGAFTGAVSDKAGRLRLAHNGTLYLTEIGDLPLPLQVKLLTFLDDKIVFPLGSTSGFQADVRVIAATHRNLEQMVRKSHFRQDLLFRLNVVRFHLPPLRERGEDIGLLLDHFLKIFTVRFGKHIKDFSRRVRHLLLAYPYPGNVRELRNIVEYATSICPSGMIESDHLPSYLVEEPVIFGNGEDTPGSDTPAPPEWLSQDQGTGLNWGAIERKLIIETLLKANGRRSKAAQMLGWGRTTLWRKMKQYGLEGSADQAALPRV